MKNYEITNKTCALISVSENETEIIELGNKFTIEQKIIDILKNSCEFYGCTLEGRIKGSKLQLGTKYKVPIIIENTREIIFFPTSSPRIENCSWISLKNIKDYKEYAYGTTIQFNDGNKLNIPISLESLEHQIFKATKLMLISRNRTEMEKIDY